MKKRINNYFSSQKIVGSLIGAVIIFVITSPVILASNHLYEQFSTNEKWFEYYAVRSAETEYKTGEVLKFNSFIEYRQAMDIRWEDTLFCFQKESVKKYKTQYWPANQSTEAKEMGMVNLDLDGNFDESELSFWEYTADTPDQSAQTCYLQGVSIGSTPLGYEKRDFYITEPFKVNQ